MNQDSELPLASLKVDGGMTVNKLLLQLQADLLGIPVGKYCRVSPQSMFHELTSITI